MNQLHSSVSAQQVSYFGKLPARGDFVKSYAHPQLIKALDQWLAQGMELLAEDSRWKLLYDRIQPLNFVCLGSRAGVAIAGHVRPSHDESGRRYPFIASVQLEVDRALDFMTGSQLLLAQWWRGMVRTCAQLAVDADPDEALKRLETQPPGIETRFQGSTAHAFYDDYARSTNMLGMEQKLNFEGGSVSVRRLILALGLLLQPVMASGATHLEKGLSLPLPRDPETQDLVATFWLDLVAGFFARSDVELVLFRCVVEGRPRLIISFNGLSPRSLQAVLHPQSYAEQNIEVDNPEWVEESVYSNYGMYKLVSYLDQPQLPLTVVKQAFREVFIGE